MFISSIDRLATLYVFQPLRRAVPHSRRIGIPILMYHSISDEAGSAHSYYATTSRPTMFAEQLKLLSDTGYQVISLSEAVRQLQSDTAPTARQAVITFDDGYEDFYTHAYPLLSRYQFHPTVFLPTGYIGRHGHEFKGRRCLTWSQVRELYRTGVAFGSHTVSHPQLRSLPSDQLSYEVSRSKETLEDELGCTVESFSYPYAFPEQDESFKAELQTQLRAAGYENGVCTILGIANQTDDPFFLKRLPVSSRDDHRFLHAKLEGAYDWLHGLQYAAKLAKG
jgi:peptidoglycan/xylan/chitin deacetylase (PgdA/CDA1 family)